MTSTQISTTTTVSKHQVSFSWKIKNWKDIVSIGTELLSETFLLKEIDVPCHFYFNFDASAKSSGKLPNNHYLMGLCTEISLSSPRLVKVNKAYIVKDSKKIKFLVYPSVSDYNIHDKSVISVMGISSHVCFNGADEGDCLSLVIELEYFKFQNISNSLITDDRELQLIDVWKNYQALFENQLLCDVIFVIKDDEIKAHTFVLAASSDYFLTMFTQDTRESKDRIVDFSDDPDVNSEVFQGFLEFIYNIKSVSELKNIALELFVLADKFDVKRLQKSCEQYLANTIDVNNVAQLLILSNKHNCEFLKQKAFAFAKMNLFLLSTSIEFPKLCRDENLMSELLSKKDVVEEHFYSHISDYHQYITIPPMHTYVNTTMTRF